jgi:hypothetical protein
MADLKRKIYVRIYKTSDGRRIESVSVNFAMMYGIVKR